MPPLPAGPFDVVLLLETMLAFPDKRALLEEVSSALAPGGRFAFTLEEGLPLTAAEAEVMPGADTVWLTPLARLRSDLNRAGLRVRWCQETSRAHRATVDALVAAYTAAAPELREAGAGAGGRRPHRLAPALEPVAARGTGAQVRRRRREGAALRRTGPPYAAGHGRGWIGAGVAAGVRPLGAVAGAA